ncbi:MAG: trehalose-phosphatase [Lawsonella clevelandensis]
MQAIHGSHVEEKKYAVALHTRTAIKPAKAAEQVAALEDQLAAIPGVTLTHGKMVSEFAVINATKDAALESITKRWGNGADAVLYLGDDITDEHIFTGLPARLASPTTEIITVKVGEGETAAQYRVDNELLPQRPSTTSARSATASPTSTSPRKTGSSIARMCVTAL